MRRCMLVALAGLLACRGPDASSRPEPPGPTGPSGEGDAGRTNDPGSGAPADPPDDCGTPGLELEDFGWLPATTRALVVVALAHEDLAPSLRVLADHARGSGHGLPIDLAFSFGEWTWQVPALQATFARAGLRPSRLVFVRTDEPSGAFAIEHDCDLDELRERTASAWGLTWSSRVEGALGRTTPGTTPPFAFDALLLPGGRMLLVAAGRGDAWLRTLARASTESQGAGARLGEALEQLDAAPIRGVLAGRALVDPDAPAAAHAQTLRVTAEAAVLDDTLPAAP